MSKETQIILSELSAVLASLHAHPGAVLGKAGLRVYPGEGQAVLPHERAPCRESA